MAVDTLEAKAHELLGQLNPGKLAAVVHLLDVMIDHEDEPVTDEDRRRFHEGQAWFAQRGVWTAPPHQNVSASMMGKTTEPLKCSCPDSRRMHSRCKRLCISSPALRFLSGSVSPSLRFAKPI